MLCFLSASPVLANKNSVHAKPKPQKQQLTTSDKIKGGLALAGSALFGLIGTGSTYVAYTNKTPFWTTPGDYVRILINFLLTLNVLDYHYDDRLAVFHKNRSKALALTNIITIPLSLGLAAYAFKKLCVKKSKADTDNIIRDTESETESSVQ